MGLSNRIFGYVLILLIILNCIDAIATAYWVTNNIAAEANPLMKCWLDISPFLFIIFKIFVVNLCCYYLWKKHTKKIVHLLVYSTLVVYAYVMYKHILIFNLVFPG